MTFAPKRPLVQFVCFLAVASVALAACGGTGSQQSTGPTVVATTSIWSDIVSNVACDGRVEVLTLIPRGADPHAFEPSLADRQTLDNSALIVLNGLGLEEGLEDTINASSRAGTPTFRAAEHVPTIEYGSDGHDEEDHDEEDHGEEDHDEEDHGADGGHEEHNDHPESHEGDDPHIWFDPQRVSGVLPELAARISSELGLDAGELNDCVSSYQAELAELDREIEGLVAVVPEQRRKLVTTHDSLGYFADRYGFEVIGTVIPAPSGLSETNPVQLQELAEVVTEARVPAIFGESQHSADDAEALADSLGTVDVVTLFTGTLGAEGDGVDSYVAFLRRNAELITRSLS